MEQEYYTAQEAMKVLKKPSGSFYRDVREGKIPSLGKRPNLRFPREVIDILAELNLQEEKHKLTFIHSTIADSWSKRQINRPYENEDTVPFKTVLEWRKRNDDITMNVKQGSKILGWVTFLPLDEEIILDLIHGRIREKDIPAQAVKKWNQPRLSVYIPVIEVIPSGKPKRDKFIGSYLIKRTIKWAISLTIQHNIKNWYAVGTTPEGIALLDAMGFKEMTSLNNGSRKGYILESTAQPIRLISTLAENMAPNNSPSLTRQST